MARSSECLILTTLAQRDFFDDEFIPIACTAPFPRNDTVYVYVHVHVHVHVYVYMYVYMYKYAWFYLLNKSKCQGAAKPEFLPGVPVHQSPVYTVYDIAVPWDTHFQYSRSPGKHFRTAVSGQ